MINKDGAPGLTKTSYKGDEIYIPVVTHIQREDITTADIENVQKYRFSMVSAQAHELFENMANALTLEEDSLDLIHLLCGWPC